MKKPSVSKSKKGAIFNILWLLVENPKNLNYFRQSDIKNQLFEEFGINLDRKTIQDYLEILIELNLPFEITHENNKGYYVSKRMITDAERDIFLQMLTEQKVINLDTKVNLFNYITFDSTREKTNEYFKFNEQDKLAYNYNMDKHYNLIENIAIIQKAIEEKRSITFEYLTYNHFGELLNNSRVYKVVPKKIKYNSGMYYLYNADKFWANLYCGTKIQYMRNIKIGERVENPKYHEKYDFSFEVDVIYDWTIEFIVDFFDDYQLIRTKDAMKAIIKAPYLDALDWSKKYAPFFIIKNKEIMDLVIKDMKILLENYGDKDKLIFKIKSAIVDYHYHNPITEESTYSMYMKGLYKLVDFNLASMQYTFIKEDDFKYYKGKHENICVSFLECSGASNFDNKNIVNYIKEKYIKISQISNCRKFMVIFYDDIVEEDNKQIKELLKFDPFTDIHDKFSKYNEAYFYGYLVFEIK